MDHLHLLVEALDPTSDLRRFAQSAKRRAGMTYSRRYGGRLWQEGYYERVMRGSDDARQFAAYVLANPVRAGLCASPGEYEYLGSDVWSVAELLESCG